MDHAVHASDADPIPLAGRAAVKFDGHGAVPAVVGNPKARIGNARGSASRHGEGVAVARIPRPVAQIADLNLVSLIRIGSARFWIGAVGDDQA